ncbi:MAG: carboxy terminal-processing peptidase [Verrucomicrobia bacterium]|nr:carboxy terminal-processing peptidase [Verrucomicrobiota bacterium]
MSMRIHSIGFCTAAALCLLAAAPKSPLAANDAPTEPSLSDAAKTGALVFSPTNRQVLLDTLARPMARLEVGPGQTNIATTLPLLLEQFHFSQRALDDDLSSKFLDRYLEVLDGMHFHFLQTDIDEFEVYRKELDNLLAAKGDLTPAHRIFSRFLQRLTQRVDYIGELLATEKFEFTGNDSYNLDRRKAPRPKTLEEAKQLWRQHLRSEILQDKLNKEKPEDIASKITKRYSRLLRSLQDYDRDDVFELYLSSLSQVYDPHTDYMGKSALDTFNINMSLSLTGIGALLRSEDGYCKIQSLVANGPAQKSKLLKENDRIIAVADKGTNEPMDVVEMKLNKVVEMIRGPKGTEVRLTIIPADAPDPSVRKTVSLIRDEIKLEDQEAKAKIIDLPGTADKPTRLGIIDLPSFYAEFDFSGKRQSSEPKKSTTRDVRALLQKLIAEHVEGIILDLRRNGGGSLEEAINLTGLFIKEGPVVQVKEHNGRKYVDKDTDSAVVYDGPLLVLTSRFSASASEILAGALQDYGRALIVGDKSTHGKGTVQQLIDLQKFPQLRRDGINPGALKVTIRKFYRPSGSSTQLKGITPDIILPSPNNHREVGESSLENALPWDEITSAKYEKLNRIQPLLAELQKRSAARVESDLDLQYLKEDIEQLKKALEDKTVSLNEEQRRKETAQAEARSKARQAELKARPPINETVYELTLALASQPGLPGPVAKTNAPPKVEASVDPVKADEEDDSPGHAAPPPVDVALKEAKRILADLISLSTDPQAIAAATVNKSPDGKPAGDLGAAQK